MNNIFTFLLLYFVSFIRGTSVIGSNNEEVEIYKKYVHDDCTMFLTCDVNTSLRKMEDYMYFFLIFGSFGANRRGFLVLFFIV